MSTEYSILRLSTVQVQTAFAATENIIRRHSKTFYFATGLLPRQARQAVRVLYGFCRATDDLVDRQGTTLEELEKWRAKVDLEPEEQDNPLLLSWGLVRRHYAVDRRYEQELIDGVGMDLYRRRYETWPELERYCYHVASTVGLLAMPIIGMAEGATFAQANPFAIRLGVALQLTNILRDVGEDAQDGRVYLPEEDLKRFGLSVHDILDRVQDERFARLMQFEIERARDLYQQASPGIAYLSAAARPSVGAAAILYREILNEIEKISYRVFDQRAHTSGVKKIAMLPGILLSAAGLKKPD
jgi:15-cis-phytoene synthase